MTKQYDDTNRGILFKNNKKTTEKHPDYTGKINVDGVDKELRAWVKKGRNGDFLSLAVKEPYKKDRQSSQPKADALDDMNDEIGF